MRQIQLTQGKISLVDDIDYNLLSQWKWYAFQSHTSHIFYAVRNVGREPNQRTERMHRLILGLQPGDKRQCDHRDGNGLNNQRANLRICTGMQNGQSRRKVKVGTSKYKGVYWYRDACKWHSRIVTNKKQIHLGCFDLETDAARAYDRAALKYHREFALTNEMLGLI